MNDDENPAPVAADTKAERGAEIRKQVALVATGGRPLAIIPRTFDDAYRIGNAAVMGKWAPYGWTKEQATLAIMHGAEVGLPPMMSLQKITVINGRPSLWGDAVPAIALATGLLEDWSEGIRGEGEQMEAYCVVKRRGIKTPMEATFSVADARRAGLWDEHPTVAKWVYDKKKKDKVWKEDAENDSPWYRHPKRMLQMRARRAFRDAFADAFSGLYIAEELDGPEMRDVTPAQPIIHNPLQDDAEVADGREPGDEVPPKRVAETMAAVIDEVVATADRECEDEFDEPVAKTPQAKPPRRPRAKAQDAPKPEEASGAASGEKAAPAPSPGAQDWRKLPAPALAKLSGADYLTYLAKWTAEMVAAGGDAEALRTRFSVDERDVRNRLGSMLDQDQLAEAKRIATDAFKKLGGV